MGTDDDPKTDFDTAGYDQAYSNYVFSGKGDILLSRGKAIQSLQEDKDPEKIQKQTK